MNRVRTKAIAEDTYEKIVKMSKIRNSYYYTAEELTAYKKHDIVTVNKSEGSCITVNDNDVVNLIKELKDEYPTDTVTVLNFASARNPGGGFLNGAKAQEESICRASDLYLYLKDVPKFYKNPKHFANGLYDSDMIYSKDVSLIKNGRGLDLNEYRSFDVITSCAVNVNFIRKYSDNNLIKYVEPTMAERIESILELALLNESDILILGAFGCGVFQNSPYTVKSLFELYLNTTRYKNKFKKVYFAIYNDTNLLNVFKNING